VRGSTSGAGHRATQGSVRLGQSRRRAGEALYSAVPERAEKWKSCLRERLGLPEGTCVQSLNRRHPASLPLASPFYIDKDRENGQTSSPWMPLGSSVICKRHCVMYGGFSGSVWARASPTLLHVLG